MVQNTGPVTPDSSGTPESTPSKPTGSKHWEAQPMTFGGMSFTADEATKLWMIISQTISAQMKKEQEDQIAALRKIRSSTEGDEES